MKFGLTPEQWKTLSEVVISPLRKKSAVWIFGSRARLDHKPFSDVDVLYESSENISQLVSEIRENIEESDFPFKVDIVEVSSLASSYKDKVLKERVSV